MSIAYEMVSWIWSFSLFFVSCTYWCSDHSDNMISPTFSGRVPRNVYAVPIWWTLGSTLLFFLKGGEGGTRNMCVIRAHRICSTFFNKFLKSLYPQATWYFPFHCWCSHLWKQELSADLWVALSVFQFLKYFFSGKFSKLMSRLKVLACFKFCRCWVLFYFCCSGVISDLFSHCLEKHLETKNVGSVTLASIGIHL